MSYASAVELNDIVAAILEIAVTAATSCLHTKDQIQTKGHQQEHPFSSSPSASSSSPSPAISLESGFDALDPRGISRAAIVHLQASVRAEAQRQSEENTRMALLRNHNVGSLPTKSTPQSRRGILRPPNDRDDVPHAEVLHARWQLQTARQLQPAQSKEEHAHSNPAAINCQNNDIAATITTSSSPQSRTALQTRLYNRPLRIGPKLHKHDMDLHRHPHALHQHQDKQSYSISGIVLFNFALSHQILGTRQNNNNNNGSSHLRTAAELYDMALQILEADACRLIHLADILERRAASEPCDINNSHGDQQEGRSGSSGQQTAPSHQQQRQNSLDSLVLLSTAASLHNSALLRQMLMVPSQTEENEEGNDEHENEEDIRTRLSSVLSLCNVHQTLTLRSSAAAPPAGSTASAATGSSATRTSVDNDSDVNNQTEEGGGIETEEAWDLFFFTALSLPIADLAKAA